MTHNTFRDGKVHVMAEKCGQCAFTPQRIIRPSKVAEIVAETRDVPGAHFICHNRTIAGDGDAICRGWYDACADLDPILSLAKAMRLIEQVPVGPEP